ncbi:dephospho-CoA kinase [Vibrio tapetis subsp. quintayensis]|uniref:dephospho-CoA kinase n=1 Tax=Vibrio tapetis TaxID=52443 RepID=UPI0025B57982|nr:dephospho-CoA kinase [Vibrio tapetis]MDN3681537.1 dephospho-CoA kinase [Vibrio tapetis subsp. quintayensis]
MALIIGLTGGIASGKTTVADLFQQHFDIDLVDADIIARQVVEPQSAGLAAIEQHFGSSVIANDGTLNRAKLRESIFSSEREKQWLNSLLHPLIRQQMQQEIKQVRSPYALLVVPLLIEKQLQSMVDRILVIDVKTQTQIQRTMQRDHVSEQQVRSILASQISREERLSHADDVIDNSYSNDELFPQITKLHKKYLAMCD